MMNATDRWILVAWLIAACVLIKFATHPDFDRFLVALLYGGRLM